MKKLSKVINAQELDNLELLAREIVEGFLIGLHRSPFHGFSVEFAEHRQYNKGESTKHMDWKLYARSGKLFVKQFEEETNLRANIVIDTSSSMLFPYKGEKSCKLDFSVMCAAALTHLLRRQRDAVGLCTFSSQIDLLTSSKLSPVHAQYLYACMEKLLSHKGLGPNRETNVASVLHQLSESLPKRSLVIVFSDFMDASSPQELFEALQHLRFNKHEVILFMVRDPEMEEQLNFLNRPTRFVDLETSRSLKLNPIHIREAYRKKQEIFLKQLQVHCGQYSIDLVEADIHKEFKDILLPYLMKRSKLY